MKQKHVLLTSLALAAAVVTTSGFAADRTTGRGAPGAPVIYVTSQGLYYDSIALGDLPMNGNFQKLEMGMYGLQTEFGPGEVGHLGGRWWLDLNGNEVMDAGDKFFLCPLLGPGRETL